MALNFRKRSTIQSVIEEGLELTLTIKDLAFKEIIENSSGEKFVVNMFNLYEKYYELLLEHAKHRLLANIKFIEREFYIKKVKNENRREKRRLF